MKCICQICNCGKHRCQHYMPKYAPVSKEPCLLTTEYQGEYQKGDPNKKVIHRPRDNLKNDGTTDYNTTHKEKFPPHEIKPRADHKPKSGYTKRNDPMYLDTEYGTKYVKGKGEVAPKPYYHNQKTQPYGRGNEVVDKSVTQQDYVKKTTNEKPVITKLKDNVLMSDQPFDAKSVHQADYQKFDSRGKVVSKRPDNIDMKGMPGYYDTTNNDYYKKHQQRPRSSKAVRQEYVPNERPFDGKSLMHQDYQPHQNVGKQRMHQHDNGLFESDDPFHNETTNHMMYKKWDVKRDVRRPEQSLYSRPTRGMDLQTTSNDYKNFGKREATKSLRPRTNVNFGENFDGVSSYQEGYVKHEVSPRSKHQRDQSYYTSDVPFDYVSENKDQYQRFNGVNPARMVNRDNEMFNSEQPMQSKTSYGDHFEPKKLPDCISTKIVGNNFKGYDVIDDFISGHRFLVRNDDASSVASSAASTFRGKDSPLPPIGTGDTQVFVSVK